MFYKVVKNLAYLYVLILFRVKFEGLENVPKDGRYIISSNHRSNFDPVFLVAKIKQPLSFMAKIELFKNKLFGWALRKLGAFPINRGSGDSDSLRIAIEAVQGGNPLLIFPEGTRSKSGEPKRPRSGVGYVAAQAGVGVLPVSIDYGEKLYFRATITVKFHPLLTVEQLKLDPESPASFRNASRMVMDEIISGLTHLPSPKKEDAA